MFAAMATLLKGGIGTKENGDMEATPPSSGNCGSA
jgi:hypothetical protein